MKSLYESILDGDHTEKTEQFIKEWADRNHAIKKVIYKFFADSCNFSKPIRGTREWKYMGVFDQSFNHKEHELMFKPDEFVRELEEAGAEIKFTESHLHYEFRFMNWPQDGDITDRVNISYPTITMGFSGNYGGQIKIPGIFVPEKKFKP